VSHVQERCKAADRSVFRTERCRKCKFLLPRLRKLAIQYPNVTVCTVDVNSVSRLPREYGITAMPSFVLFADGARVDDVSGGAEAGVVFQRLRDAIETRADAPASGVQG
jgi:thioredoxin-like negative regulator of GroEL